MQRKLNRDERGVSALVVGLLATTLIAAVGLSVDTGNLVLQKNKVQQAADSAALAVAEDCARGITTCSPSGASATAQFMALQNANASSVTAPTTLTSASGSAKITVSKSVPMAFASAIGILPKTATASATASWDKAATEGYPLLPLAVDVCTWVANAPPKTAHLTIRTDLISSLGTNLSALLLGVLKTLLPGLFPSVGCTTPSGASITMTAGALWLPNLKSALDLFGWLSSTCVMKVSLLSPVTTLVASVAAPSACVAKLGTSIHVGDTVMLPIFRSGVIPLTTTLLSPLLGFGILGFAPFKITGWVQLNNVSKDPALPANACSEINLLGLLNLGCSGIQGYFVKTIAKQPTFQYSTSAENFGNTVPSLVQ